MLSSGVRVAVGTDSRASNPDLSILSELRHIARHHPSVPPEEILKMGTLYGAEALGLADRLGSLTPGKLAAFAVVPIPDTEGDPYELLGLGVVVSCQFSVLSTLPPHPPDYAGCSPVACSA